MPPKTEETAPAPTPAPTIVYYHAGEKLRAEEANLLLRAAPTKVVFFAGSRNSGKTTFLARIGELFRDGTFTAYRFAGSLTLCAIERVTWRATIGSGGTAPTTTRTFRIENDSYIHLRIHHVGRTQPQLDLLLSDLAGETFPTAISNQQFCRDLDSLGRADHLVVFLDSEKLIDTVQRHSEVDNLKTFLAQVATVKHNCGLLTVDVVFSRRDFVELNPRRNELEAYCQSVQDDLGRRFNTIFGAIRFWRVAARPKAGMAPTNALIQEMFASWVDGPALIQPLPVFRNVQPARDFSAYGLT